MSEVHDRLGSWKAIAEYLDRDPTTVMRWVKERGLPVHVLPGEGHRRRAVYAFKTEIDGWLRNSASGDHGSQSGQNDRHSQPVRSEPTPEEEPGETEVPEGKGFTPAVSNGVLRSDSRPSTNGTPPANHEPAEGERIESEESVTSRAGFPASRGMTELKKGEPSSPTGARREFWTILSLAVLLIAVGALNWLKSPLPEPRVLRYEQLTNDGLAKGEMVTDGARIYFTEYRPDGQVVAEVPASGGDPVVVTHVYKDLHIQDISLDRTELLVTQELPSRLGPVWILPLTGGPMRRLGSIQAYSAAWSPDGEALGYAADGGVYLCDADGSNPQRIAPMSGIVSKIHWSPDGRQLCLTRIDSNEQSLWEVTGDGKDLHPLFSGERNVRNAGYGFWTPDLRYLVFTTCDSAGCTPYALRQPAGLVNRRQQLTRLTSEGLYFGGLTASQDSSRFYCIGGTIGHFQIESFDLRSKQFIPYLRDVHGVYLDFTKDGEWIAYVGERGICKSRDDGSGKVDLTLPNTYVEFPRWSPDGKWIAFMGRDPGQPWKVRVISAEGGTYGPLTSTSDAEGAPTWSPDGSRLAFGGLVDRAAGASGPSVIHIYDLKQRRLSSLPGSEGHWTARWSPDGRYVAALTSESCSLMLFDFRSGKWSKVLTVGRIWDIEWTRRGRFIYMTAALPGGDPCLFRFEVEGRRLDLLTSFKDAISTDRSVGVAPDDSPLVYRRVSGTEIYALQCQFP
jgi:Tol biopolymer transport system component